MDNPYVLFDVQEDGSCKCFHVGISGCTGIQTINHGKDKGGIEMCSFIAHFDDGRSVEIESETSTHAYLS